jgi:hypothetical protein
MPRHRATKAAFALLVGLLTAGAAQGAVVLTSVEGWPNGRPFFQGDPPPNAVDGNINSYTWTTAQGNFASPAYLGVGFATTPVNRIRLWKTPESGYTPDENIKDLVIQYTNDNSAIPLDLRSWQNVFGLTSGYLATELFNAASVNLNGTVTGDVHDSPGVTGPANGWGSLSFSPVQATGIRIGFSNNNGNPFYTHYRVGEFEVYAIVPEPATVVAFLASVLSLGIARRILAGSKPGPQLAS